MIQRDFKQIERINRFLAPGGLRHLMFYYQDVEVMDTGKATYILLQCVIVLLSKCARKRKVVKFL